MKKDIYINAIQELKIIESVSISIEPIKIDSSYYKIVFRDPFCNAFEKQYTESQKKYLKEQLPFELFKAHNFIAQRIFNRNYK